MSKLNIFNTRNDTLEEGLISYSPLLKHMTTFERF